MWGEYCDLNQIVKFCIIRIFRIAIYCDNCFHNEILYHDIMLYLISPKICIKAIKKLIFLKKMANKMLILENLTWDHIYLLNFCEKKFNRTNFCQTDSKNRGSILVWRYYNICFWKYCYRIMQEIYPIIPEEGIIMQLYLLCS